MSVWSDLLSTCRNSITQTLWCMISVIYEKDIDDGGNNEKISACSKVQVDYVSAVGVWGGDVERGGQWRRE